VDKNGHRIDCLLTEHRAKKAACRFLKKALRRHGVPEKMTIDGSEANAAIIKSYNEEHCTNIMLCQATYLNNIVEARLSRRAAGNPSNARVQII
jgi:transposase-like protein